MEETIDVESQTSESIDDDEISDAGSVIEESTPPSPHPTSHSLFARDGLAAVGEGSIEHDVIKNVFLHGMGDICKDTDVVAMHKSSPTTSSGLASKKARLDSFRIFSEAMANKCGGDANTRYAWYGGTRDDIREIVKYGFSQCARPSHGPSYGFGLHLAPAKFAIDGAASSAVDEDGLRHVLLCRVIMGNMETVCPGSKQSHPSSRNFDSGVDNPSAPRRYVVWSAFMNSHILPAYIITFKVPDHCLTRIPNLQPNNPRPSTPWMSIPALMTVLSRTLSPSKMALIHKSHKDFRALQISRPRFIQMLRLTAGDELLAATVKRYRQH
ncbi:probable inactive poly [ADP-ribose] polymerase SRO2 [Juglans microcarpa x Juglans regia]|uniref:probable inactive poly [ADP-ribose] polymerase SRO2 n=1 Tax=Juglans microcarpa x Juglans regia TaxID=2249226 RepID=UPI001B7F73F0|nr:probable inactive poly [ADP-ribose] polymerase SRO2 [Juglans microcarpa x Juglans regia]XP_041015952.1 probable inactive poly [ADP-ribose] polymerase SRO2 [Juglans microcarpa x Juglans regia]XP_041015953.1 probable inactive poly [ADP-ribose] polymerase SRO2 [Juglans microcarpa x Juglans regia]